MQESEEQKREKNSKKNYMKQKKLKNETKTNNNKILIQFLSLFAAHEIFLFLGRSSSSSVLCLFTKFLGFLKNKTELFV